MNYSKWDKLVEDDEDDENGDGGGLSSIFNNPAKKGSPITIEEVMKAKNMNLGDVMESMKQCKGLNMGSMLSGGSWQDGKELRENHLGALRDYAGKVQHTIKNTSMDPISSGFVSKRDSKSLKVIKSVKDLKVGQINLGVILWCTVIEPIFRVVGLQVLVEDDKKVIFTIAVYNYFSSAMSLSDCQKALPVGCRIGLKEPYLKCLATGYLGLRVDNPINMDVVIDAPKDGAVKSNRLSKKQCEASAVKSSLDFKNIGNEYFRKHEYNAAVEAYSAGISAIKSTDPIELQVALFNNRCTCYIKAKQYVEDLHDARSALLCQPSNVKAAFKEAESLSGLRRYKDSSEKYNALIHSTEINKEEVYSRLGVLLVLIGQSCAGIYQEADFFKINSHTLHSELEDYYGPIRIASSAGKGRGVFAIEDIPMGSLILVEKPFVTTIDDKVKDNSSEEGMSVQLPTVNYLTRTAYSAEHEQLIFKVIEKAKNSKANAARLSMLYDGTNSNDRISPSLDFFRYDDHEMILNHSGTISANKIREIINFNAFGDNLSLKDSIMGKSSSSLFIVTSFFNHSKAANVVNITLTNGGVMRLVALEDIKTGNELFITYTDGDVSKWGIKS